MVVMKSLKRIRNRHKRCYELAMKVMLEEPGAEKFTLVHGRTSLVKNDADAWPTRGHAWIELEDGKIYDVVLDRTFSTMAEYVAHEGSVSVEIDDRYTRKQAAVMMLKSNHMGPWRLAILQTEEIDGGWSPIGWRYIDET
jgi:hypothetical protein